MDSGEGPGYRLSAPAVSGMTDSPGRMKNAISGQTVMTAGEHTAGTESDGSWCSAEINERVTLKSTHIPGHLAKPHFPMLGKEEFFHGTAQSVA